MHITRLGNVILAVKDLDKAVEFYHDVIGLPIKNQRRTWVDLGTTGALISLHPASLTAEHVGSSIDNGITIGFTVGDVTSAVEEIRSKNIPILRDVIERDAGKNAIIQDPDGYLVSLFEPTFKDAAQQAAGGYHGFTPS
ncbi:MAG: Glyoxalase-like domain-containing protein [Cenarchaeum symbiont of Oopsacas minuta]|nr:Glyoxalase/bleomycin resistance protein/dioxygenase [Cenarchaeum symbiont of Oopsacas minuta]MDI1496297.1 Glyoxalase-like domain-containing protein [Cenarchaeum symbiont of Oopsacas minuta]